MSWQATSWVSNEVRVPLGLKALLYAMSNYAQPDGSRIFPTQKRLAEELCVSVRTIQRMQLELEQQGLIRRGDQSYGRLGLANPRHAPIVWDFCMQGSGSHRLQANLPPIGGAEDPDPPAGDRPESANEASGSAESSQVNRYDNLSPQPDLGKHAGPIQPSAHPIPSEVASSQVNRHDNLSPQPDLRKQDPSNHVDSRVDNVGTTDDSGLVEATSGAGRYDRNNVLDATPTVVLTTIGTTNQPPPAGANASLASPGSGPAPTGGPGGPLVVVDSSGPDSGSRALGGQGPPGGGHRGDVRAICDAVLAGLPEPLRAQVGRRAVLAACEPVAGLRVEPATMHRLVQRRGWDQAGPGVVIRWLRDEVAELLAADQAAWEPELPTSVRVPWCGRCDDPQSRWVPAPDGRGVTWCPDCHPRVVGTGKAVAVGGPSGAGDR